MSDAVSMTSSADESGSDSATAHFVAELERHAAIVRKVAGAYARTESDRLDLMQEIGLQLWKAWPRFDRARPFATWMYRIALNVGISFLRARSRRHRQAVSMEDLSETPRATGEAHAAMNEEIARLRRVMDELEPLDRALLVLHLDERPHREIADVLGISETNAATKVSRLKQRIRERLMKEDSTGEQR